MLERAIVPRKGRFPTAITRISRTKCKVRGYGTRSALEKYGKTKVRHVHFDFVAMYSPRGIRLVKAPNPVRAMQEDEMKQDRKTSLWCLLQTATGCAIHTAKPC